VGVLAVLGGAPANMIVPATFYFALWLGLLGVPSYAIVTGVLKLVARIVGRGKTR